jgi:hypothetical protein
MWLVLTTQFPHISTSLLATKIVYVMLITWVSIVAMSSLICAKPTNCASVYSKFWCTVESRSYHADTFCTAYLRIPFGNEDNQWDVEYLWHIMWYGLTYLWQAAAFAGILYKFWYTWDLHDRELDSETLLRYSSQRYGLHHWVFPGLWLCWGTWVVSSLSTVNWREVATQN